MGGDHGATEVVPGALDHARAHRADRLILVGDESRIRAIAGETPSNVEIVHAAHESGRPIREVAREMGVDEAILDQALDHRRMARPHD